MLLWSSITVPQSDGPFSHVLHIRLFKRNYKTPTRMQNHHEAHFVQRNVNLQTPPLMDLDGWRTLMERHAPRRNTHLVDCSWGSSISMVRRSAKLSVAIRPTRIRQFIHSLDLSCEKCSETSNSPLWSVERLLMRNITDVSKVNFETVRLEPLAFLLMISLKISYWPVCQYKDISLHWPTG